MHRESSRIYSCILDLLQHVSASHCLHQGVVVTSEAIVDVYGLRFGQLGQLSRDAT
jgi:hypothetical protein